MAEHRQSVSVDDEVYDALLARQDEKRLQLKRAGEKKWSTVPLNQVLRELLELDGNQAKQATKRGKRAA